MDTGKSFASVKVGTLTISAEFNAPKDRFEIFVFDESNFYLLQLKHDCIAFQACPRKIGERALPYFAVRSEDFEILRGFVQVIKAVLGVPEDLKESTVSSNEGELKATKEHLTDMRDIARKFIDMVTKPGALLK